MESTPNRVIQKSTCALETLRLLLRPLRLADAPRIQRLFPHFEILEFMDAVIPWPYPEGGASTHLKAALPKVEAASNISALLRLSQKQQTN